MPEREHRQVAGSESRTVNAMAVHKEIGVKGVYFEGQNSWAAYFPNYYIAAQCMWEASQDGQALFADLMQSFFQEAAPEMT